MESLLQILRTEGLDGEVLDEVADVEDGAREVQEVVEQEEATDKRNALGLWLNAQRQQH